MINLLLLAALAVQEPAPIRVTTRMVEVSITVQDKYGNPVSALTADDFRIFDGGREEVIRTFQPPISGTLRRGDAGVFENRAGQPRVCTAILLDYLNTWFGDEAFGRGELLRFLKELEPDHPVALLSLDVGLQVLHDFSTDTESLLRTMERYRPARSIYAPKFARPTRAFQASAPAQYRQGVNSPFSARNPFAGLDALAAGAKSAECIRQTASASAALAWFLSRVPGRKNLIWVSSVFPAALAASVRRSDIAVYPVDVRTPITGPTEAARQLAERTGGVAFDHGNSVLRGIRQAYRSSASAYILGYYPSHANWDGKFRTLSVTVRREDVQVRHRPGYVAAIEETPGPRHQQQMLWAAASSPVEAETIPVVARVKQLDAADLGVSVAIDARALFTGTAPGDQQPELELLMIPQREDGAALRSHYFRLLVDDGKQARARYEREGVILGKRLEPPAGAYKLRVVVRDIRSGGLGSVTVLLNRSKK